MSHKRLIQVAWELHQRTRNCPRAMVVNATKWLEDCYAKAPDWKTAFAIAVHYLVLALSQMETDRGEAATDYLALALRWNATKDQDLIDVGRATPAPPPAKENGTRDASE